MTSPDAGPLRFDCPACGATLTVPASIAGLQGPCPKCWQEIISPDPARGEPAKLPLPPVAAEAPPPPEPALRPPPTAAPIPPPETIARPPQAPPSPVLEQWTDHGPQVPAWNERPVIPVFEEKSVIPVVRVPDLPSARLPVSRPTDAAASGPGPAPKDKQRSPALLALGIVLPLLCLGAVGYHLGKDFWPVKESPAPKPAPANPPVTPMEPPPLPGSSTTPAKPGSDQSSHFPPTPLPQEAEDAGATLLAFLGAPDWKARSAFVFYPEKVRQAMEEYATTHGDRPFPISSVELADSVPPHHVFTVRTESMPDGFPVGVTMTTDGPKIGWNSFVGFHDDHFKSFIEGPADRSGIFDVLVKPSESESQNPSFVRYILSVPMPNRSAAAFARKDSVELSRLRFEMDGSGSFNAETIKHMIADIGGVPLVLALTKRNTPDGRGSYIEINDLVAVQWGERPPP